MDRGVLPSLAVFAAVARAKSFRRAAGELGVSPSVVSHTITRLERSLSIRLLERTTRSVELTPEGRALLAEIGPALETIHSAIECGAGEPGAVRGRVRLVAPRIWARHLLSDALGDFSKRYPQVELEINVDDAMIDIVTAGYDAGVRLHEQLERDAIAFPLSRPQRMLVVAAPSLLERVPRPTHPRNLLELPCIALRLQNGNLYAWEFEKGGETMRIAARGPIVVNDDDLALAACRQGAGFAFLFEPTVAEDILTGRLVPLLEDWAPPFAGFYLYHTGHRQMRPPLRAFIEWARDRLIQAPESISIRR